MKQFNNFRRMTLRSVLPFVALAALTAGCTQVDDTLGANLVPENQQMKAGHIKLAFDRELNPRKYVETRLFLTDSILASNLTYGYLGAQLNDTLGLRTAGFLTQMGNYYFKVDSGYFGYKPIFDSAQLQLAVASYGSDTLTEQTFAIYEIVSNAYLTEKPISPGRTQRDTAFYAGFDPLDPNDRYPEGVTDPAERVYDPQKKLFTFTLGGSNGPSTTAVTLRPTAEGRAFVNRLMLQEGEHKDDYSLYSADSLEQWLEAFKGLYICPDPDAPVAQYGKGAIYSTTLEESGLTIYARNRVKDDPSLIKDTVGMTYYFYNPYDDYGNVSVNVIGHDYAQYNPATAESVKIIREDAEETNASRPETPLVYVEGMGGVVTEITFAQPFFDDLEAILDKEYRENGKQFETLAFSQVRMSIYFTGSDYDWSKIDPASSGRLVTEMTAAPQRLGLYTNYKRLTAISDYAYLTEQQYEIDLAYGGYINRSRGCYVMDITGYVQQLWNSYREEKTAARAEGRALDLDKVTGRKVYLAPEAYSLYTPSFGVFQGAATDTGSPLSNNAPIRFDVTYNMIK